MIFSIACQFSLKSCFVNYTGDLGDADEQVELLCWGTDKSIDFGTNEQEPLALLVVHAAMHMSFLPQFTCDFYEDTTVKVSKTYEKSDLDLELRTIAGLGEEKQVDTGVPLQPSPLSIVWSAGAGVSPSDLGFDSNTRKYDKNRLEVLRLLLVGCCDPLFAPADEYNPLASRWLAVATAADAPNGICLFYSLLNTVLSYTPSTLTDRNHIKIVQLSIQVLCVLLDCGLPGKAQPVVDKDGKPVVELRVASKGGFNIFRTVLARMDNSADLKLVYEGFAKLLKSTYESEATYLSSASLDCYQELLVLFWKFLEENPYFMNYILNHCDINEIIVPICYLMYKSRRDPAKIGLVHICTFVLLKLSGERSFGVSLNRAFTKKLPTDLPLFHGCHTDLLCITLHKLVVNGAYKLVPLYSCFLTIISNISPYWKSMSLVAAVKLVNLFELFSSPKFLYSGEYAYRHLALLLEVFNNIIQYQYHGNAHLVYAIVRRKDSFGNLVALDLTTAQAACHKVYGEHTTVTRDPDAHMPVNIETKGIPGADDEQSSQVSSIGEPFQPSEEWLAEVKESLPLETVSRLLQHLVPVVDNIIKAKAGVVDEKNILDVLNDITMVGLLPVPHPIVIRKYQPNQYTALWFTAFLWGVIFLRNQELPLFDGQCVELFQVSMTDEDDDED